MPDRFPGYDVMAKRNTPSWNEATRRAIDQRLSLPREPRFFTEDEWQTLNALCERIVPQPRDRPPVPLAAMIDHKMTHDMTDGYRNARLPRMQDAWRRGLRALDAEAQVHHERRFHVLAEPDQNALLQRIQQGEQSADAWGGMPAALFFKDRAAHDIIAAYYAHPTAWNEIGFGGPASARGYVRMGFNRRDPWEAVEAGHADDAGRKNRRVG
jgi:hypothetical protein